MIIWIRNFVIFPHTTIIPHQDFLHGHILFYLDNPGPDFVERHTISNSDVAEVNLSDSDSALFSKFLNPGLDLAIFQIWESGSSSDCGCNNRPTVIYPCFYLRNDHTDSCYCQNWKVTPGLGPFFFKFLTPGRIRVRKENTESLRSRLRPSCSVSPSNPIQIKKSKYPAGLYSKIRFLYTTVVHQWWTDMEILQRWSNLKLFHEVHIQSISKNCGLQYPIQIRKSPLSFTLANIFGNVYFASWVKSYALVILPLIRHYIIWTGHVTRTIH